MLPFQKVNKVVCVKEMFVEWRGEICRRALRLSPRAEALVIKQVPDATDTAGL